MADASRGASLVRTRAGVVVAASTTTSSCRSCSTAATSDEATARNAKNDVSQATELDPGSAESRAGACRRDLVTRANSLASPLRWSRRRVHRRCRAPGVAGCPGRRRRRPEYHSHGSPSCASISACLVAACSSAQPVSVRARPATRSRRRRVGSACRVRRRSIAARASRRLNPFDVARGDRTDTWTRPGAGPSRECHR